MDDGSEQSTAIVVGELEHQVRSEVDRALRRVGAHPRFYGSLRNARNSRSWPDASLVVMARNLDGKHPLSLAWGLRLSGYSSRLLLMLPPEHDSRVPPDSLAGADDVTLTPANATDIARRAGKLLARASQWPAMYRAGPLAVAWNHRTIALHGHVTDLTKTERSLLSYLVYRGCLVSWSELSLVVLGVIQASPARSMAPHLAALRRKLAEAPDLIETVHGVGCRLHASLLANAVHWASTTAEAECSNEAGSATAQNLQPIHYKLPYVGVLRIRRKSARRAMGTSLDRSET
jgi:DNA-binding response OmpR family regulator